MSLMELPDAVIHYQVEGAGDPILLIRGYGSHLGWWHPAFIDALKPHFSLILYDHRGTGKSEHRGGEYSIPVLADDAAKLLEAIGIEEAIIFGLSMGGMVAMEMALSYPQRVKGLILGATHCGGEEMVPPSEKVIAALLSRAGATGTGEINEEWLSLAFTPEFVSGNPGAVEAYLARAASLPTPPEIMKMQAAAVANFSIWGRLQKIKAPTWILHGKEDAVVPRENAEILVERIPGARVTYLNGLGHDFPAQEPVYTAGVILAMLGK